MSAIMVDEHPRFHPSVQRAKAILDSGELGAIKHIEVTMAIPRGLMKDDDIRFKYEIGGGAMMDMGCECILSSIAGTHLTLIALPRLYNELSAIPRILGPQIRRERDARPLSL